MGWPVFNAIYARKILFLLIGVVSTSQNKSNTFLYEGRVDKLQHLFEYNTGAERD